MDVNAKDNDGKTALIIAAESGCVDHINAIIAAGADVNAPDSKYGRTALMKAAYSGNADCVKALITADADVNATDKDGQTALTEVVGKVYAGKADAECIRLLIAAGADVNAKNNFGHTVLGLAAGSGKADCVKALVAAGADVNAKRNHGLTALSSAAFKGAADCVKALIAAGADVNATDDDGDTVLKSAVLKGDTDCIKALVAAGAKVHAKSSQSTVARWRKQYEDRRGKLLISTEGIKLKGTLLCEEVTFLADLLRDLQRSTRFEMWLSKNDPEGRPECYDCKCGVKVTYNPIEDGFVCDGCGRLILFSDYLPSKNPSYDSQRIHKAVVELGELLAKLGGVETMRSVAKPFADQGGNIGDLSRCWNLIGGWLD